MKRISIVVPVYNEEENIAHFAAAVEEVMGRLPYDYELLFIDDGSSDRSREILRTLSERDARIGSIFLARNYGHQLALTCGIDHADGGHHDGRRYAASARAPAAAPRKVGGGL